MSTEILEVYHQLRTGDLAMVYARYDDKTGLFYCTLRPRPRVVAGLPSIPNALALALQQRSTTENIGD